MAMDMYKIQYDILVKHLPRAEAVLTSIDRYVSGAERFLMT